MTWRILLVTLVLCLAWSVAMRLLARPELAETNSVANRLRIERWFLDAPVSNVLVGSSISGRILPAYFKDTSLASMANLGLDGGNPDTGLALVLNHPTPPARVFLEVHRLIMPPSDNDAQLLSVAKGAGLQSSRYLPWTRADWRPSTLLYAWLKQHQTGGAGSPAAVSPTEVSPAPIDPAWVSRIRSKVAALRVRGTQVILLRLPVGVENPADPQTRSFADDVASQLDLPLVDLYRWSQRADLAVTYTDGLHMTPASAKFMARGLIEALGSTRMP